METIFSKDAPPAVGPFSQAVLSNGLFFCSGTIGINPGTRQLDGSGFEEQMSRAFENIKAVLAAKQLTLANVVKVNVYLTDMANYSTMNTAYENQFGTHKRHELQSQ
jgi:2-iminobutanoate/2-iminopropanoate deaminase